MVFWKNKKIKPNGIDKKTSTENLLILKKVFDENNLTFYLANGTLLGSVRDKDFIDGDTDTDICIFSEDIPLLEMFISELINNGLKTLRINSFMITFIRNNNYIDIDVIKRKPDL